MTDPQYNRQAQAWDNKTPDESDDGLPPMGVCPWCQTSLAGLDGPYPNCPSVPSGCEYDGYVTEGQNRSRWLREEADRMRGEECENEADRRSQRGGW